MSVNENIEDNNESNFPNIKIVILGVLSTFFIIGGLCYRFTTNNQPPEEPTQEAIKEENNNQETEKQEEVIVHDEYIPVIDCLWLNIPIFVIVEIVSAFITILIFVWKRKVSFFGHKLFMNPKIDWKPLQNDVLEWVRFTAVYAIIYQVIAYIIWFILMLIFATFSKIWDKKHSWWSNVKKGFLRNRLHRGWLSLIPILLPTIIIFFYVFLSTKRHTNLT